MSNSECYLMVKSVHMILFCIQKVAIIFTKHLRSKCRMLHMDTQQYTYKKNNRSSKPEFGGICNAWATKKANLCAYWQGAGTATVPVQLKYI